MGLARWMSWDAWQTDKLGKQLARQHAGQDATSAYQERWREGQIALVAQMRTGGQTIEGAAAFLNGLTRRLSSDGWYAGQRDLVARLQDGRITLRAAALNLGMIAPDEE